MDLYFVVHKLAKLSSNPGKVHFEGLVQLLRYIMYNKSLILRYYSKIEDTPLTELLRQARINTEKKFMMLSDSIWKEFPDTGRSIGTYNYVF